MSRTFTSWLLPFTLGASTALSLVWVSRRFGNTSNTKDGTSQSNTTTKSPRSTSYAVPPSNPQSLASSKDDAKTNTSKLLASSSTNPSKMPPTSAMPPTANDENAVMDSTDLDHRLLRKAEAVLQWRTTRLVVVVERCTNDHNYSAILRTAEALGIQNVYMIDPPEVRMDVDTGVDEPLVDDRTTLSQDQRRKLIVATPEEIQARRQHHLFARNATEWLAVHDFATSQECVAHLRQEGYQLWVTDLGQESQSLTMSSPKIPDKVALVMGTEAVGCSQYLLDQADLRVYLPLRGFADSLNLSVATALIIHQLFVMDPTLVGGISEEEKLALRQQWYSKLCRQRLLTSSQRKERKRLQGLVQKCQTLYERTQQPKSRKLQPTEQQKLDQWDMYKAELAKLDALVDPERVQAAVQEWVQNPPAPLTDVRRADEHRVCFVGKNTKAMHGEDWKDMVATSNATSKHLATAAAFREKVQQIS